MRWQAMRLPPVLRMHEIQRYPLTTQESSTENKAHIVKALEGVRQKEQAPTAREAIYEEGLHNWK